MNSFVGCFICSTAVQTIILLINARYIIALSIAWEIIVICAVLIQQNAPAENINRELEKDEKNIVKGLQ